MNHKKFLGAASAALMIVIAIVMLAPGAWAASKYKTLYKFKGGKDGYQPWAGLLFDRAGNLYGTTYAGATDRGQCSSWMGCGVVFKLTPNPDGSWTESVLYSFCSLTNCADGALPYAGLTIDTAGNLYGATSGGGNTNCSNGCGTVFKLAPNANGQWTESVIHSFTGSDGYSPTAGLIFDKAGNLYGTTYQGGSADAGVVFELTPEPDGSWTENLLYTFCTGCPGQPDGTGPDASLSLDAAGNLYGTTVGGSWRQSEGTVFKLAPNSDGSWTESVVHIFYDWDGPQPRSGVIVDSAGNLYGTTRLGSTVFKLTQDADGGWTEHVLLQFDDESQLWAGLIFDAAGNLYGTAATGGPHGEFGFVFKMKPKPSGGWSYHMLHAFMDKPGACPVAGLILDAAGNLYGTTAGDGIDGFSGTGSVFEITP